MATKSTRAPVPKPARLGFAGEITETPRMAADNMARSPGIEKDLNFKVSEQFHYEFKSRALADRMTMKELLEASFTAYKEARKR